jgi:hypothetical protein
VSGAARGDPDDASASPDASGLPPLVLHCRPIWRLAYGGAALVLLGLGASTLAADLAPGEADAAVLGAATLLFLFGAGCAHFFLRYCCARLMLTDRGFRLAGPLRGGGHVAWSEVRDWRRFRRLGGHAALHIVHGPERFRLSVPLIYEDGHLLEIGLGQRRFPVW